MYNKPHYFIQTRSDNQILNQGCYTAYYGAKSLGYDITLFKNDYDKNLIVSRYPGDNEHICIGGISTLRNIIKQLGCKQPEMHFPHNHLPEYLGRKVGEITIGELKNNPVTYPLFIKPLEFDKEFTGYVLKSYADLMLLKMKSLPDNFKLFTSEVVNFISEYRIFIHDRKIVGAKNYAGKFNVLPEFELVEYAINDYKNQKIAYSLDFGITDQGETLLIEINDAFGIAPYGLEPTAYLKMLTARWQEIMKTKQQ